MNNKLKGHRIGIVGAGNMGRALALGLCASGSVAKGDVMASDVDAAQRKAMQDACGIEVLPDNKNLAAFADVLILAVKPQVMDAVLKDLAAHAPKNTLLISIAAGITLARIEKYFPQNPVIRVMPNTPALVRHGMAALCAGKNAGQDHVDAACAILRAVGEVVIVPESSMDAVTAVSGSGPAYVYYFIEALVEGARAQGLPPETAAKLVIETIAGSIDLLQQSEETPEILRKRVTSPGGTTEAALKYLEAQKAREIWMGAIAAAAKRGKELSNG